MSMPQVDLGTRSRLAVMLAGLEEKRREFMLRGNSGKSNRKEQAKRPGSIEQVRFNASDLELRCKPSCSQAQVLYLNFLQPFTNPRRSSDSE